MEKSGMKASLSSTEVYSVNGKLLVVIPLKTEIESSTNPFGTVLYWLKRKKDEEIKYPVPAAPKVQGSALNQKGKEITWNYLQPKKEGTYIYAYVRNT